MPPQPDPHPPDAYTVHQVPGRMRLRVPARRGDRAYFANVAQVLVAVPDVRSVRVNPSTGSVLVRHAGPPQKFATHSAEVGLFRLVATAPAALVRRPARSGPGLGIAPLPQRGSPGWA